MKKILISITLLISNLIFAVTTEQIEKALKRTHRGSSFHGNILVKKAGKTIYSTTQGLANREWQVPHHPESKFMIASLTKQFTAYAILNLENEGKLNIDDSVAKYIKLPKNSPIEKQKWQAITIRHLLSHTAGLKRDIKRTKHMSTSDYNLLGTIVFHVLDEGGIIFKETGQYYYSNLGYLLLAQVIEKVSKSYYMTYLKGNILGPMKMYDTDEYHRRKSIMKMADGYFSDESRRTNKRCCHDASLFTGSHNLYSTVADLDKWNRELNGETNILNRNILERMKEAQVSIDQESSYAFGLNVDTIHGLKRIWHTGHEWGYSSLMTYIPELKLSIIYLSNFHGQSIFSTLPNNINFQNQLIELLKNE